MGTACVKISSELFLQILPFPDGTEIVGPGNEAAREIVLTFRHPDLKEGKGSADPQFSRRDGEVVFEGWGQK